MECVKDKSFRGETIRLDGKLFLHCSFNDCLLTYGGDKCEWENTSFNNCRVVLDGAANNTAQVLTELGFTLTPPNPEAAPAFRRIDDLPIA